MEFPTQHKRLSKNRDYIYAHRDGRTTWFTDQKGNSSRAQEHKTVREAKRVMNSVK